jgi:hypothetical protein
MWYSEVQHPDGPQMPLTGKHTLVGDLDGHVREDQGYENEGRRCRPRLRVGSLSGEQEPYHPPIEVTSVKHDPQCGFVELDRGVEPARGQRTNWVDCR